MRASKKNLAAWLLTKCVEVAQSWSKKSPRKPRQHEVIWKLVKCFNPNTIDVRTATFITMHETTTQWINKKTLRSETKPSYLITKTKVCQKTTSSFMHSNMPFSTGNKMYTTNSKNCTHLNKPSGIWTVLRSNRLAWLNSGYIYYNRFFTTIASRIKTNH